MSHSSNPLNTSETPEFKEQPSSTQGVQPKGESDSKESPKSSDDKVFNFHTDENIDLTKFPIIDKEDYPKGTLFNFGDSHGNALNILNFAIRRGGLILFKPKDESQQELKQAKLENESLYNRLVTIYKTLNHIARKADYENKSTQEEARQLIQDFSDIIEASIVREDVNFNWSGDNLSDRGGYHEESSDALDANTEEYPSIQFIEEKKSDTALEPKTIYIQRADSKPHELFTSCFIYEGKPPPKTRDLSGRNDNNPNFGNIGIIADVKTNNVKVYLVGSDRDKVLDYTIPFKSLQARKTFIAKIKSQKDKTQTELVDEIFSLCETPKATDNTDICRLKASWLDEKKEVQTKLLSKNINTQILQKDPKRGICVLEKGHKFTPIRQQQIISECGLSFTPWGNDLLNLIVFDKLGMQGIFSNHDQNALKILEDYLDSKDIIFKRKDEGDLGSLKKNDARTLNYLIRLIETGIVGKEQVKKLLENYKKGLKAFSYTLDESKNVLTIRPHAPVGLETIEGMAELYGIPFPAGETLNSTNLCNIIDKINEKFLHDVLSGRIHEKIKDTDNPGGGSISPELPLTRLIWNRGEKDHAIVMPDKLTDGITVQIEHGHDGPGQSKLPNFINLDHDTGKRNLTGGEGELAYGLKEMKTAPDKKDFTKLPDGSGNRLIIVRGIDGDDKPCITVYYMENSKVKHITKPAENIKEIDYQLEQLKNSGGTLPIAILTRSIIKEFKVENDGSEATEVKKIPYPKDNYNPYTVSNGQHAKKYEPSPNRVAMLNALRELNRQDDEKSASPDYLLARVRLFEAVEQAEIEDKDLPAITELFNFIKDQKNTPLTQGDYQKRSDLFTDKIQSLKTTYPDIYRWAHAFRYNLYLEIASETEKSDNEKLKNQQHFAIHNPILTELLKKEEMKTHPLFSLASQLHLLLITERLDAKEEQNKSINSLLIWIADTLEKPHRYKKIPYPLSVKQEQAFSPDIQTKLKKFKETDSAKGIVFVDFDGPINSSTQEEKVTIRNPVLITGVFNILQKNHIQVLPLSQRLMYPDGSNEYKKYFSMKTALEEFIPSNEVEEIHQALSKGVKKADETDLNTDSAAESGKTKLPMIKRIAQALPEYKKFTERQATIELKETKEEEEKKEEDKKVENAKPAVVHVIDDQDIYRDDIEAENLDKPRYGFIHAKNPGPNRENRVFDNYLHWAEVLLLQFEAQGLPRQEVIGKIGEETSLGVDANRRLNHLVEYYELYKLWCAIETYREQLESAAAALIRKSSSIISEFKGNRFEKLKLIAEAKNANLTDQEQNLIQCYCSLVSLETTIQCNLPLPLKDQIKSVIQLFESSKEAFEKKKNEELKSTARQKPIFTADHLIKVVKEVEARSTSGKCDHQCMSPTPFEMQERLRSSAPEEKGPSAAVPTQRPPSSPPGFFSRIKSYIKTHPWRVVGMAFLGAGILVSCAFGVGLVVGLVMGLSWAAAASLGGGVLAAAVGGGAGSSILTTVAGGAVYAGGGALFAAGVGVTLGAAPPTNTPPDSTITPVDTASKKASRSTAAKLLKNTPRTILTYQQALEYALNNAQITAKNVSFHLYSKGHVMSELDVEAIQRIEDACFAPGMAQPSQTMGRYLQKSTQVVLIKDKEKIVACLLFTQHKNKTLEVDNLIVAPEVQQQGYGGILLRIVTGMADNLQVRSTLLSPPRNQEYYEKAGFEVRRNKNRHSWYATRDARYPIPNLEMWREPQIREASLNTHQGRDLKKVPSSGLPTTDSLHAVLKLAQLARTSTSFFYNNSYRSAEKESALTAIEQELQIYLAHDVTHKRLLTNEGLHSILRAILKDAFTVRGIRRNAATDSGNTLYDILCKKKTSNFSSTEIDFLKTTLKFDESVYASYSSFRDALFDGQDFQTKKNENPYLYHNDFARPHKNRGIAL